MLKYDNPNQGIIIYKDPFTVKKRKKIITTFNPFSSIRFLIPPRLYDSLQDLIKLNFKNFKLLIIYLFIKNMSNEFK